MPSPLTATSLGRWALGFLAVLAGLSSLFATGFLRQIGQPAWDFAQFYVAGKLWSAGQNPYDLGLYQATFRSQIIPFDQVRHEVQYAMGLGSSPAAYWVAVPFSQLPLQSANDAHAIVSLILWGVGFALLAFVLTRNHALNLWTVALLFLLIGGTAVRDSFRYGQVSAFLFLGLALAFALLQLRLPRWAGAALALTTIKPQTTLLLVPYFAVRRSWGFVMGLTAAASFILLIPAILTGQPVFGQILDWITQVSTFSEGFNSPDPYNILSAHMVQLEIIVARVLGSESIFADGLTIVLLGLLQVAALAPMLRRPDQSGFETLDFALACAMGVVAFYGRWYSLYGLFPGLLILAIYVKELPKGRERTGWLVWLLFLVGLLLMPTRLSFEPLASRQEAYWARVLLPYHAWTALAVVVSLIGLSWRGVRIGVVNAVDAAPTGRDRQAE